MNVKRGDVVLVDFPLSSGAGTKVRPSLVVQNDRDNMRLANTVVAQITGNILRSSEATQVLIELSTQAGKQSGLQFSSVVNCANLATLEKTRVLRRLGDLPDAAIQEVNAALKAVLDIP
jgi:mRNA interferase MazF